MATTTTIVAQMLGFTTAKGGSIASTKTAQPKKARDSYGLFRLTSRCSVSAVARNSAASLGVGSTVVPARNKFLIRQVLYIIADVGGQCVVCRLAVGTAP